MQGLRKLSRVNFQPKTPFRLSESNIHPSGKSTKRLIFDKPLKDFARFNESYRKKSILQAISQDCETRSLIKSQP
jgi:hypothetical protein